MLAQQESQLLLIKELELRRWNLLEQQQEQQEIQAWHLEQKQEMLELPPARDPLDELLGL